MSEATEKKEAAVQKLIVNQITVTSVRRDTLDVGKWREAIKQAGSLTPNYVPLLDLLSDVLIDEHLTSELGKLLMAITNSDLQCVNEKNEEVPEIMDLVDTPDFETCLEEFVLSKMYPHTLCEFTPGTKIFEPHFIERKNIHPEVGVVRYDQHNEEGINYREGSYKYWVIELYKKGDLGLLLKAAFWVIIKRGAVGDWAELCEVFGMPTRVGEYDAFDEGTRIELQRALDEMSTASRIMKPKGTEIQLIESKSTSPGELHSGLVDICNKAISILFLGQTLTTLDKSGSGQAQGTVHADTKSEIIKSYKRFVRRILNKKMIPILENLGFNVKGCKFIFPDQIPIAQRLEKIKLIQLVKSIGVPVDDDTVYEQSGLNKPKDYDVLKAELKANKPDITEDEEEPEEEETKPKKKTAIGKKKELGWWLRFRTELADFFDPALKH